MDEICQKSYGLVDRFKAFHAGPNPAPHAGLAACFRSVAPANPDCMHIKKKRRLAKKAISSVCAANGLLWPRKLNPLTL
jgi:hypothetical protein